MTMERSVKLADLDDVVLTASQGFARWRSSCRCTPSKRTAWDRWGHWSETSKIEGDGRSTDPAALGDWQECVRAVLAEDDDSPPPES